MKRLDKEETNILSKELLHNVDQLLDYGNKIAYICDAASHELLYANSAAIKYWGKCDFTGQTCFSFIKGTQTPCETCAFSKLDGKKSIATEIFDQELKRWFHVECRRIGFCGRDAFIQHVEDITEEKKFRNQLLEDDKLIEKITTTIYEFIALIDVETHTIEFRDVNEKLENVAPTKTSNYDQDNIYAIDYLVIPEEREYCKRCAGIDNLTEQLKHMDVYSYTWTQPMKNGEPQRKKLEYCWLDEEHRKIIALKSDITEEYRKQQQQMQEIKSAQEIAEKANAAKSAFLSRISHDMRTPLNGILGLAAILKESITDESNRQDLNELEMSGKYLMNLINDTLDINRIESGRMELHPVVYDGRTMLENALNLAKTVMNGKNLKFNVSVKKIPFTTLYVDVGRFEQILMNVIGNAVKFTPEGGKIDFIMTNLSVEDGVITDQLQIRDSGIGMSAEFLPHIFEPFSQENSVSINTTQGTGLGMAITKHLLQIMGGDISVESEIGKGTCFTMLLKFQIATEEQIEKCRNNQIKAEGAEEFTGKRILLCEDHPLNTTIATRILQAKGIEVEHAENGKKALDMFSYSKEGYYDGILMDIRMPVMDGIEATKEIRKLKRRDAESIPIVAMTANAFAEDKELTKNAGMNAHLSKPIQTDELYATLAKLFQQERRKRIPKILVVDDIEMNRVVIKESLQGDYDIVEAANGRQALDMLQTCDFDLIITDVQMPVMDGMELIRQVRSDARYKQLAIIANTQFGDQAQEEELLAIGANDFVYKPTTPKIIEHRVKNAIRRIM